MSSLTSQSHCRPAFRRVSSAKIQPRLIEKMTLHAKKQGSLMGILVFWRQRPDSNWGWRFCRPLPYHLATLPKVLQGPPMKPRSSSVWGEEAGTCGCGIFDRPSGRKWNRTGFFLHWSGQRGSNSLPPPWQGGALPDELCPHMKGTFRPPTCGYFILCSIL